MNKSYEKIIKFDLSNTYDTFNLSNNSLLQADTLSFSQTSSVIEGISTLSSLRSKLRTTQVSNQEYINEIENLKEQINKMETKRNSAIRVLDAKKAELDQENKSLLSQHDSLPPISYLIKANEILENKLKNPGPNSIQVKKALIDSNIIEETDNDDDIISIIEEMTEEFNEIPSDDENDISTQEEIELKNKIEIMKKLLKSNEKTLTEKSQIFDEIDQLKKQLQEDDD